MTVLVTDFDPHSAEAIKNRAAMDARLSQLEELLATTRAGGGERYTARHRERGKLLARERVELLLDRDAPFLELMPFAGWDTEYLVGASIVCGIGVVADIECLVIAHDPTVRGGSMNPHSWRKATRALEIARENRLPVVTLVESGGGDLSAQGELFVFAGQLFRDLSRLSRAGVPTVALVFGSSTAGGAYMPGMCDYSVFVEGGARVFLGGPPLVQMATGEISTDEALGGAAMHSRVSGLSDYLARDEFEALRVGREIIANLNWHTHGRVVSHPPDEPLFGSDDLLAIASADPKVPFDPREVLARVLDGSRFAEFKPVYGSALCTGWGSIHGYRVGVLANARGIFFSEEAQKATHFIQLANQQRVPLLFLHNTTGFMVGEQYEQGGIIKHGAHMINAVSNSQVPHIGLIIGASYGAANYAMSGRAYAPRFLFSWPNATVAVMGPQQLAGVLSIVARASAETRAIPFDEKADAARRAQVEAQIEHEQQALYNSSKLYDDGVLDPRDTRTVLGICLSLVRAEGPPGNPAYGVFRM